MVRNTARFALALLLTAAAGGAGAVESVPAPIDGAWKVVIASRMGRVESILSVVQTGGAFTGSMAGRGSTQKIADGQIHGDQVSWRTKGMVSLLFSGAVSGDHMSGSVKAGPMGTPPFTADRIAARAP